MLQCIIQPRNGLIHNSHEMRGVFPDIRVQLNDQLRCLDNRLESQHGQLAEIQDIFRRRAEIELSYSRDLEKLAKLVTVRHKEQKQKREGWSALSSTEVWKQLVEDTRKVGKDHAAMAEIYSADIPNRCITISEDIGRIYRKCREIGFEIHEEVLKSLHELHTAMKTHHTYQSEFRQAESKLAIVEKQKNKLKDTIGKEKLEKSRKYRLIEKEVVKRTTKYTEARMKATKARTEYLLYMEAANSSIHKYFVDDLSDLIDCMDFGFHQSLIRVLKVKSSAVEQVRRSEQHGIDVMNQVLSSLDSRLDKKKFLEMNEQAFMLPKKFEYQPVRRDESELVQKPVLEDLELRQLKLAERISSLRTESEETWKSLESTEKNLLEIVSCADYDTSRYFTVDKIAPAETQTEAAEAISRKQKVDRMETEQFYLAKFRDYILNSNRISRLQAKYDNISHNLGKSASSNLIDPKPAPITRKRIGRTLRVGQSKLFGGGLEEYLEAVDQDIPIIVKSCVRVINLYGLHHQGIFRVSGSKVEINNFREAFERGDDPLVDMTDASDINSVAGVLKLYLRELREPVFSVQYFDQFMELARTYPLPQIYSAKDKLRTKLESKHEFVVKVKGVVKTWQRPIFNVMRYLFSFLNHLSEYSDENMMDPYNLAICFGPTLVPIPAERDQVQHQNMVNELIKNFIIFHEDIFPNDSQGTVYEKYISSEPEFVREFDNEEKSLFEDETDNEPELTDEESEILEAQAQYDFTARSSREVSFKSGDTILLYAQVSGDWWRGSVGGREGLIPDKYILLKIRGDDDQKDSILSLNRDSRRSSSQTDTLRSTRSERNSQSTPRSLDPSTENYKSPPLLRSTPHRHSISHTPVWSVRTTATLTRSASPQHETDADQHKPSGKLSNDKEDSKFPVEGSCKLMDNTKQQHFDSFQDDTATSSPLCQSPVEENSKEEEGMRTQSDDNNKPYETCQVNLGARPKTSPAHHSDGNVTGESQGGILLKQASWGSRIKPRENKPVERNFARKRELWEKRSSRVGSGMSSEEEDDYEREVIETRNSIHQEEGESVVNEIQENNPERQRAPIQQTPDLVLDIPPGALAESPTVSLHYFSRPSRSPSSESLISTSSESSAAISITTADTFASVSDTIKKINKDTSTRSPAPPQSEVIPIRQNPPHPTAQNGELQGLMSTSSTFKPVLKVKPVKQVSPDDTQCEEQ